MTIAVLTYDHPHRKTQDVIWRLMAAGHWGDMCVVATPWVYLKERNYIYAHRPAERHWSCEPTAEPAEFCSKLGLRYEVAEKKHLAHTLEKFNPEAVVIGGAGILAKEVVVNYDVINVHPGMLPARRGLDVLKWAIIDCVPAGVTAHICDEHTDLGWRLLDRVVPVYAEDSFQSFAMRQYEYELSLIPPAVELVLNNKRDGGRFDRIRADETKAFKRMPLRVEAGLLEAFGRYKKVFS